MGGFQGWRAAHLSAWHLKSIRAECVWKGIRTIFWDLHVFFQFLHLSSQQLHAFCHGLIPLSLHQSLKHIQSHVYQMQFLITVNGSGSWTQQSWHRLTFFNSSLSPMYFSAALLASSACACKAAVLAVAVASWLIKVTTRFITLQKQNPDS